MTTAVVVGSGPNGLAAAVFLAREGVEVTVLEAADTIGGGTRTSELTPGLLHDHCSATHPMAVGSPFLRSLDLGRHGLTWCLPDIDCAHPLDSGEAGVLHRSVEKTADGLGEVDGRRWRRVFQPLADGYDALAEDLMRPLAHLPRHPLRLAAFGPPALLPTAATARLWRSESARALFAGVAAHAFRPFDRPASAAIGLTIIAAGHRHGWPVAAGGSRAIGDALAAQLTEFGGRIETGVRVRSEADLPPADVVLFDLAPRAVADILGDRLPRRVARAYRRYRHGPGAFKVDFAVQDGVPWTNEAARRAAPSTSAGTTRRSPPPSGRSTPDACRNGRSSSSGSNTWPIRNARRATSTRSGRTRTSHTATTATPRRRSSRRSSGSPRIPRAGPGPGRPPTGRLRGVQPELRRR